MRAISAPAGFAMALVVAVPLAFDPGGYFIFLPVKWTLAMVLVFGGVAALIYARAALRMVTAWCALLVVVVASSVFGIGGVTSWIGYPGRYLGVIAWITFFAAFALGAALRDHREHVVRAASAAAIGVSLYAIAQAAGIDPLEWSAYVDVSRARSTLGNAAFLGAYLALIVPIAGRLSLVQSEDRRWRVVHGAASVAGAIALLTTQTRGAWLGAVGGIVVVAACEARTLRDRRRRAAALVGAGVVVIVLLATVSPFAERIRSIGDPSTLTGRGRLLQWERTVDLVAERPVLGWGPDTYAFAFPRFIDAEFERTVGREVVPDRAHNLFLDVAASSGVIGVGVLLVVLTLVALAALKDRQRDAVTVGLTGGCAAYLVQLQFSFQLADLDVLFWLFAGMLIARTGTRSIALPRVLAVVPLTAAIAFAVWGTTDVIADRALRSSLDAQARDDLDSARRSAERASGVALARAQYDQAAARLFLRAGEATGNVDDFKRALKTMADAQHFVPRDVEFATDRGDIFVSWGQVSSDRELIVRGADAYEDVLGSDPNSGRAHLKVGVAYVLLGRDEDAERAWLRAADLAPRSPAPLENLIRLYEQQNRRGDARRMRDRLVNLEP